AGPIVRYHDVAHQLAQRTRTSERILQGLWRFALGLAKKVLIANTLGQAADTAFSASASSGGLSAEVAWLGILCYAFQIYFDFSGYSDMAIGLGRMFGFDFLENFNAPYIAENFTDFWRRWHISLSNWMREYLYFPLGGNRAGPGRTAVNLWIVFLISGLWHGAAWNFVVWGLFHGVFLSLDKYTHEAQARAPRLVRIALTFILVNIGWVFFRAETLTDAMQFLASMIGIAAEPAPLQVVDLMDNLAWCTLLFAAVACAVPVFAPSLQISEWHIEPHPQQPQRTIGPLYARTALIALALMLCTMMIVVGGFNPFIYFRF
ncbi:MAG: MBOAT family O-acyltransferase, partial [Myxococcota bacterium]